MRKKQTKKSKVIHVRSRYLYYPNAIRIHQAEAMQLENSIFAGKNEPVLLDLKLGSTCCSRSTLLQ